MAILDEIDSGLDIDALRDVAGAVNGLRQQRPQQGVLMVTHYKVGGCGGGGGGGGGASEGSACARACV